MKKINEMMISAYLKGMSKLNAFKDNESGEVNMVANGTNVHICRNDR